MIEPLESRLLLTFVEDGTTLVLEGSEGNDRIIVVERNSTLIVHTNGQISQFPKSGIRRIFYSQGPGDDYIKINSSINAELDGWEGNDTLIGGAGNDTLAGDRGNDRLFGRRGDDFLTASLGHNLVMGGPGNDTIVAQNRNRDTINGGAGNDDGSFDPGVDHGWKMENPSFIDFSQGLEISWPNHGSGPLPDRLPPPMAHAQDHHHVRLIPILRALLHLHPLTPIQPVDDPIPYVPSSPTFARYDSQFGAGGFTALFKFPNLTGKVINWDFSAPSGLSVDQLAIASPEV